MINVVIFPVQKSTRTFNLKCTLDSSSPNSD